MPIINGMKMACEPCIRGHRSTKCTHANERLMVPVKKPGRPLSTCPHIHNQICGCSSVTAAIPRKQKCCCGTSTMTQPIAQKTTITSTVADISPLAKPSFRVQKSPASLKPHNRKQSYDPNNFGRIENAHINVVPFQSMPVEPIEAQASQNGSRSDKPQVSHANAHGNPETPTLLFHPQHGNVPRSVSNDGVGFSNIVDDFSGSSGSLLQYGSLEVNSGGLEPTSNHASCCAPVPEIIAVAPPVNVFPEAQMNLANGCCFSKETDIGDSVIHQSPFPKIAEMNQLIYNYYDLHTTVFAYPPSYGSYLNPLQPSEWRKSIMSNMYGQPAVEPQISNGSTFTSPNKVAGLDTLHSCSCGPGCQCIGCAAHPYNDATQDYVRSAYRMTHESSNSATIDFINGQKNADGVTFTSTTDNNLEQNGGNDNLQRNGGDFSPQITTSPSDNGIGEEQNLSASDFFFVSYPFSSEECGGDTVSCPCGDDCECIGCTIHRFSDPETILDGHTPAQMGDNGGHSLNGAAVKHESLSTESNVQAMKSCCG